MNSFVRRNRLSIFILFSIILICVFLIDSTERYNNLVSFRTYKGNVYSLEKIDDEDINALKVHVYSSRVNWILGRVCFSRNIASYQKGKRELYSWEIKRLDLESITLTNNGRELVFSVTGCF